MSQLLQLTGESYRNFIYSIKSNATKTAYIKGLKQFMEYRRVSNCEDLLQGPMKLIQSNIIEWIIDLKENRNLSYSSVSLYSGALRHFYDMNDITLNWKKIKSFLGENNKIRNDRPYTRQEIHHMLDSCTDQRVKIAILLMSSGGLRVGAIQSIRLENLTFIERYGIYQIDVYKGTRDEYTTFCTPECARHIQSYLEYRKRNGEGNIKGVAPLIREEFDINDAFHASKPRPISSETLRGMINRLLFASGIRYRMFPMEGDILAGQASKRHEAMQCHALRKYFDSTSTTAGLNPLYVEMLMGHKIGLKGCYFRPTKTDLLEGNDKMSGYVSVMHALTIGEEDRLKLEVKKLTVGQDDITVIKVQHEREMKELRNDLAQLIDRIKPEVLKEGLK